MTLRGVLFLAALTGCGSAAVNVDGGTPDAGNPASDAGSPVDDASLDSATDASVPRADVPAITCTDIISDVYITPNNLPPMTNSTRGDIVRCAADPTIALPTVQSKVNAKGITTKMTSSVSLYRVSFRTTRGDGSAGASTARVYLPTTPLALPLPVLVAGHPTEGMGDGAAPSKSATSNEDLALPWAGLGYAVIVPDYAGLGNEGVQGYLDNHDQAHSILDGARALRKMLSVGAFSTSVAVIGYSQGGGAALSAQALASSYGADGTLVGVVAFAPEWPTRHNSFGFVDMLENPSELTIQTGISYDVVEIMRTYGYFANYVGMSHVDDAYPSSQRSGFDSAINAMTEIVLGGYIQGVAPTISGFIDDTFRTTLLACIQKGASDSGCIDPGKSYFAFMNNDYVTADPSGARVLYVQGLADYVMPPSFEAACNVAKLTTDGLTPQVCVDAPAQHTDVVGRNMDFAITWLRALLDGQTLPGCTAAGILPPCTP